MKKYFKYGDKEVEYLKSKDKKLGEVIDRIGMIRREVRTDLFESVVNNIVGQQISTKAHVTIWNRLIELVEKGGYPDNLGDREATEKTAKIDSGKRKSVDKKITPQIISAIPDDELQSIGLSFRKVEYIKDFTNKVLDGEFDIDAVEHMSDEEAICALSALKGIGVWTAEMLLLFCLQRPDILSYGDLAIRRGMRMVYRHRELDKKKFEKYRRRLSPYGSVAGLYFWAVAGGAIPELTDPAPKKSK